MIRDLLLSKKIGILLIVLAGLLVGVGNMSYGQAVGDYGTRFNTGTATNWNTATNWVVCVTAGTWTGATTAAAVPSNTKNVWIRAGGNYTINATATCASINIAGTLTATTFGITVAGPWVNNGTFNQGTGTVTFSGANAAINLGTGTENFYTIATATTATTLTINAAVTVAGNLSLFGTSVSNTINITGTNSITVTGTTRIYRPTTSGVSTLNVGAGTLSTANLTLSGTSNGLNTILTVSTGTVTVTGNFTASGSANPGGSRFTFTDSGKLNVGGSTTNAIPQTNTAWNFTPSTSTVNFTRAGTQTIGANNYSNLTLSGTSAKTTTGATVTGILSIEGTASIGGTAPSWSGTAYTLQYKTTDAHTAGTEWITPFAGSGGVIIANTAGSVTMGAAKVFNANVPLTINAGATLTPGTNLLTLGGNFTNLGTFTSGSGGVTISGTAASQSIDGFTTTGTVSMTKTAGTATFDGNVNGGAFVLNGNGGTLDLGSGLTHTFTGAWTRTDGALLGNSSTLNIGGSTTNAAGTFTAGTSTVNYTGVAQTIADVTYYNLALLGGNTKTFPAATTINNDLSIASGTKANLGTYTHTAVTFTRGGSPTVSGSWGSTSSSATNQDDSYFALSSGIVNVSSGICVSVGDPAVFGNNVWNVYGYNGGNIVDLNAITYRGYYTVATGSDPSIDTRDSWTDMTSASYASGYQGCAVDVDNMTFVHKRQGFPCGTYQISVGHDDDARLYVNGTQVWAEASWIPTPILAWTGFLDENSTVELRVQDGNGASSGQLVFAFTVAVTATPVISSPICSGVTSVSGTSSEADGTVIEIFNGGVSQGTTTVSAGAWTITGLTALTAGNVITATAIATNKCLSSISASVNVNAVPSAPSTTGGLICVGSTATLTASGGGAGDQYQWYDAATSGILLQSGVSTTYTTPVLGSTTDYWVSILNTAGCEGSRTQVTATYPSISSDNQNASGTDSWVGHVYDGTNLNTYFGSYLESEAFNQSFGGDATCFNITSSSVTRSIYTETFSVRYRMNSSKQGLYVVDLGSDDGSRLTVDGVLIYNNWIAQAFSSRPRVLVNLTGSSSLEYDFYEQGGGNQVVFQNLALVLANSLNNNISQDICLGSSGASISGDAFGALPTGITLSGTGYQWAYSTASASGPWIDISGATSADYTPSATSTPFDAAGTYFLMRKAMLNSALNNIGIPNYLATNNSNSATLIVTPSIPASVSIGATATTICAGTSVTFTATPTNGGTTPTYQWKLNGSNVGTGETTYNSSTLVNGDLVSCEMTSNATPCLTGSPATSNTITMIVNANLTPTVSVSANPTGVICYGTSVTFTASPTNGGSSPAYQWYSGSNPISGETGTTFTSATLINGETITVQITSNETCLLSGAATSNPITMTVDPTITLGTMPVICVNVGTADIPYSATTGNPTHYSIDYDANAIAEGFQNFSNYPIISPSALGMIIPNGGSGITPGIYQGILTVQRNSPGTCVSQSYPISVTISSPVEEVSVLINVDFNPLCAGTSVTFTASPVNGGSAPIYQWKVNGIDAGTNSATYTVADLANGDVITCVLTSAGSCASGNSATSNALTMTVNPTLPASVSITASANPVCDGTSVTFTATPTNGGTPGYQWYNGASLISGENNSTYTTATIANGDAITVEMTSDATCATGSPATSNTVTMTVNTFSVAPTGITGTTTICEGGSTTLTLSGGTSGTGATAEWFTGSCGGTSAGTGNSITVSPASSTTYFVRYNGTCNTTTCASVSVTVNTLSVAPTGISGTNTICAGGSTTLTLSGGTAGTGATAEWFTGSCGGTSAGTGNSITVSPASSTTYFVRYNGTCNTTTCTSVSVTVNTLSIAPTGISGTITICEGGSTTLTLSGGTAGTGATAEWFTGSCGGTSAGTGNSITVSPASNTTYFVRYNGTCNTTTCASVTVTVNTLSVAPTSITGTTTICEGGSTTLTLSGGTAGTGATAEWFTGSCGGTSAGTGNSIIVSPASSTTYFVRYNGTCNTTTCASVTVTVNTLSLAPTSITGTTTICEGGSTTLTLSGGTAGTGATAEWFTGSCGGTSAGTGNSIIVSPASSTTYFVRYNGTCNTTTCASVSVTVNTLSVAPTGISGTTTICEGGSTTLTLSGGTAGTGATTEWFTGSCGGTSAGTGNSITVSPASGTTYFVRYAGTCNTTTCASVSVTVNLNPIVSAGAVVSAICQGSTSDPLGGSYGGGATSAVWSDGGAGGSFTNNGGSTPETATYIASIASSSSVTLTLTTNGGSCGTTSDSKQITVNPIPTPSGFTTD